MTLPTEQSKAATRGQWNDVWDAFDRRKAAKVAVGAAKEGVGLVDMFGHAGVAAE